MINIQILFENFMDILETSTTTDMIRKGKLSQDNIKKLNDAGMLRSKERYMAGIDRGAEQRIDRSGADLHMTKLAKLGGGGLAAGPSAVKAFSDINKGMDSAIRRGGVPGALTKVAKGAMKATGYDIPKLNPDRNAVAIDPRDKDQETTKAHEAGEVAALKRFGDKVTTFKSPNYQRQHSSFGKSMGKISDLTKDKYPNFSKAAKGVQQSQDEIPVGKHAHPEVLRREKEQNDYLTNAYGERGFRDFRNKSGEYAYVSSKSPAGIRRAGKRDEINLDDRGRVARQPTPGQVKAAQQLLFSYRIKAEKAGLTKSEVTKKLGTHRGARQAAATLLNAKKYGTRETSRSEKADPTWKDDPSRVKASEERDAQQKEDKRILNMNKNDMNDKEYERYRQIRDKRISDVKSKWADRI